jgi:predicted dehydrogenase
MKKTLTYGMVGGDLKAFIGDVHRKAAGMDSRVSLVAGAFSADVPLGRQTAATFRVSPDRTYDSYQEMAAKESVRPDKIDFVSICTPNFLHYQIAKAFLNIGVNVICEKPLCFTSEEAKELIALAKKNDLIFGMTYSYTGYPMVKLAREMIQKEKLGKIIGVKAEYLQDWMIDALNPSLQAKTQQNVWRTSPKFSGKANTIGDIGTHTEDMLTYLLGQKPQRLLCCKDNYGMPLELSADILLEYVGGLRATITLSQVALGYANGFGFRIFGDKGSLQWTQETPDVLLYTPLHQPTETLKKKGEYLASYDAYSVCRLPTGHPEGFYCAFGNVYRNIITSILKKKNGEPLTAADQDFPTAEDGLDGVQFVEKAVLSAADESWVNL